MVLSPQFRSMRMGQVLFSGFFPLDDLLGQLACRCPLVWHLWHLWLSLVMRLVLTFLQNLQLHSLVCNPFGMPSCVQYNLLPFITVQRRRALLMGKLMMLFIAGVSVS